MAWGALDLDVVRSNEVLGHAHVGLMRLRRWYANVLVLNVAGELRHFYFQLTFADGRNHTFRWEGFRPSTTLAMDRWLSRH